MDIRFGGKKALVTGAGKGIGRATAKALVKCGAEVVALERTKEDLDSLVQEIPSIHPVLCDLGDLEATKAAVESVGPIDLLVNNAGIGGIPQPFLKFSLEYFDKVMKINVRSALQVSQIVAKGMVKRGTGGAIVNVSSVSSKIALQGSTAYSASKGALDIMSKVMAMELGPHKIRVNTVNPATVKTDMAKMMWGDPAVSRRMLAWIPLGKFLEVEDVVHAILFLLSDKAAMVTGETLIIDGGLLSSRM